MDSREASDPKLRPASKPGNDNQIGSLMGEIIGVTAQKAAAMTQVGQRQTSCRPALLHEMQTCECR
jgi:hypothetical protein